MKFGLGSKNCIKLRALRETLVKFKLWDSIEVIPYAVKSDVRNQPLDVDETLRGAQNRAKRAYRFKECDYGVGIESGLMKVMRSKSGVMDFCACAIYHPVEGFYNGFSSSFELPQDISDLAVNHGQSLNQAAYKTGLTNDQKIGNSKGLYGILSEGRACRYSLTSQAVFNSLISLNLALKKIKV